MQRSILSQLSPLYTDLYQFKMAQGYFLNRRHHQKAIFDLHFRHNPYKSGYVIAAGIDDVVSCISHFRFQKDDLDYLRKQGFEKSFLQYLKTFRFQFSIESVYEGEVVFPKEPLMRVEGGLLECVTVGKEDSVNISV